MIKLTTVKPHVDTYFDESALNSAKAINAENKSKLIYMKPEHFLQLARTGHGDYKEERVETFLKEGAKFPDIPYLWLDIVTKTNKQFRRIIEKSILKVIAHEGRHRNRALQARGYTKIPVIIHTTDAAAIYWNKTKDRPDWVKTQDEYKRFKFSVVFPEAEEEKRL